jgi:aspartokinase
MSFNPITKVSVTFNIALITVDNLPNNVKLISDILSNIAEENINIDMISQVPPYKGTVNVSFTIPAESLVNTISLLNRFKKGVPNLRIEVDASNTKISAFGEQMVNLPGVAAKLFTVLAANDIELKLVTTSEVDISILVYEKDVDRALEAIKSEFGVEVG